VSEVSPVELFCASDDSPLVDADAVAIGLASGRFEGERPVAGSGLGDRTAGEKGGPKRRRRSRNSAVERD
jgi:hypothetical protein